MNQIVVRKPMKLNDEPMKEAEQMFEKPRKC